jgi:beta-lactamase regulating signal transducer with metallopeptidase domain
MIEPINTIARLWWDWMIAMSWQVGLLVGIIGCVDMLIRKWAWPQLRYALWSLILLKLLLPPTLSLPSGIISTVHPALEGATAQLVSKRPENPGIADFGLQIADSSPSAKPTFEPASAAVQTRDIPLDANPQSAISNPQLNWRVYVMGVWLLGATILGVFLAVRLRSLSKDRREILEASPVPESFYNRMSQCASRVGLRRLPRVVPTTRLANPAVFGVFRPVLLMPVGYLSQLSRQDVEHVLLHEFCHIKRGDLFVHGLTLCLQVVYWFHPLLWLARRHIHHLRELCCDASVANVLREDTPAYRETLLETARRFLATSGEPGLGLLGLFEDSNCLLMRLNWLQKPTWRYRKMKKLIVVVIAGFMAACVLPMAQAQPAAPVHETATVPHSTDTQMMPEMRDLQTQMRALQEQMQQLARRMGELSNQRAMLQQETADIGVLESYTVKEGDTLAKIAEQIAGSDPNKIKGTITWIQKANKLPGDRLRVGQRLLLPGSMPDDPNLPSAGHIMPPGSMIYRLAPGGTDPSTGLHALTPPGAPDLPRASVELKGHYSVTAVKPNTVIQIKNEIGSVKVSSGDDQNCTVIAKITGRADTEQEAAEIAKKVQIQVTPQGDKLLIRAVVPDGAWKENGKRMEVAFEITVPRQSRIEVVQQVGNVKLLGIDGHVRAVVETGSITGESLAGNVDLETRVGSITMMMPADASAKIEAATKVGSIKSDVPLDITGTAVLQQGQVQSALGSAATGTLGAGRNKMSLQAEVGSIRITSGRPAPKDEPSRP